MNAIVDEINWWGTLQDKSFLTDPYPQLKAWRELGAVHHDRASDIYFVLGHKEFAKMARAPQMGRDTSKWRDGWASPEARARNPESYQLFSEIQPQMINVNGADHARMRGVFENAFRPAAIAAMAPMIKAEADRLLEALGDGGEVDLIKCFAAPMPLRVLCNLLDIPAEMDESIRNWSASMIRVLDIMTTQETRHEALVALHEFKAYLTGFLAERRKDPGEGIIAALLAASDAGILNPEETLMNLVSMLIAGHETTVTLIGNGMLSLLRHPDQLARLRADRSLTPSAVEEFLRYEPGGNMILRVATEDFPVGDKVIPAGCMVLGLIGAVNRDPASFVDPDQLDVGRSPNHHFTFGAGAYTCIGAGLARLEGQIAFDALLDRFPSIELAGEARWRLDRVNARGLENLPVRLGRGG